MFWKINRSFCLQWGRKASFAFYLCTKYETKYEITKDKIYLTEFDFVFRIHREYKKIFMPELPEVETIRRDLLDVVLCKNIIKVDVIKDNLVKQDTDEFINIILNNQFLDIERRGKLLSFSLMGEWNMLVHLRMTGQLMYKGDKGLLVGGHSLSKTETVLPNPYSYIIFTFFDDTSLYFNCMRQFGYMQVVGNKEKEKIFSKFGPEPLLSSFTLNIFKNILYGKTTVIKPFLLDQTKVAGIGNIYVDEACFDAGILPDRRVNTLSNTEIEKLYNSIKKILSKAVKERGTTFNNYVDANGNRGNFSTLLKVYGRGGMGCKKCGEVLEKIKVGGRGTVFCGFCQK